MIELFYVPNPIAQALAILLEESGLSWRPYRPEGISIPHPGRFPPLLMDDEPVSVDHPIEVFHPGASMIHLATKARSLRPEMAKQFCPEDPSEKFAAEQWVIWQMACQKFRSNDIQPTNVESWSSALFQRLNSWLSVRRYIAGSKYSIADMTCYPWVEHWRGPNDEPDPRYDALRRWVEEVRGYPGVSAGMEQGGRTPNNGRELPGRLARAIRIMRDLELLGNGTTGYPP